MKILPYDNFILITKLSVEEVKFQLQQNIETGNYFKRQFTSDKIYEGYVFKDKFEIQMIIPSRSPAKAVVKGVISTDLERTKIQVTLIPHAINIVLYIILFLFFSNGFRSIYKQSC